MPPMLRAMARGVALFLVGSLVLVALLGCGRWFEQREPWRHDAEVECLQSGAVREGPSVALLAPIEGPGICGADFPVKVTALGAGPALGFADDGPVKGVETFMRWYYLEASEISRISNLIIHRLTDAGRGGSRHLELGHGAPRGAEHRRRPSGSALHR